MQYNEVLKIINDSKDIAIVTHESPDGDAIGSSTAMYLALTKLNKKADLIIKEYSSVFNVVDALNKSIRKPRNINYDLVIVVDSAKIERVNEIEIIKKAKYVINIDHHISNSLFGNYNIVEGGSPACCQVLINLFKDLEINIDKEIATSLLVGIITDTNGFRNQSTNKETLIDVANMLDLGVNLSEIYMKVLSTNTMAQFKLKKIADNRLEFFENGKIAFTYITEEDKKKVNAQIGDHEGIVDVGRCIEGVEVSIFFHEKDGMYKVSLRSNSYVNVSEIGLMFNGGGHFYAAGFESSLSLLELKNKLIEEISIRL